MAPTRRATRAAAVLAVAAVMYALSGCSSGPASGPATPQKTPEFPAARQAPPTPVTARISAPGCVRDSLRKLPRLPHWIRFRVR